MDMTQRHFKEIMELLAKQVQEKTEMEEAEVPVHLRDGWIEKALNCPADAVQAIKEIKEAILYMDQQIDELFDDVAELDDEIVVIQETL